MNYEESKLLEIFSHRNGASFLDGDGWHYSRQKLTDAEVLEHWKDSEIEIALGFGAKTQYQMLDIDHGSMWHPRNSEDNYQRLLGWLAEIGLVEPVAVRSSLSMGLHVYFPLSEPKHPRRLAERVQQHLLRHGAAVSDGVLELFPNVTTQVEDGSYAAYKRHRLPLQSGGALIGEGEGLSGFIEAWAAAAEENALEGCGGDRVFGSKGKQNFEEWKTAIRRIEADGWTGKGQTNEILGKLSAFYMASEKLFDPSQLAERVLEVIASMPGYLEFCGHTKEIAARCLDWAKSAIARHSRKYGNTEKIEGKLGLNKLRQEDAIRRISSAIDELKGAGELVGSLTAQFKRIAEVARCSVSTIRKHRDRWFGEEDHTPQETEKRNEESRVSVGSYPPENAALENAPKPSDRNGLSEVEEGDLIKDITLVSSVRVTTADCERVVPIPPDKPLGYLPNGIANHLNPFGILSALWPPGEVLQVEWV